MKQQSLPFSLIITGQGSLADLYAVLESCGVGVLLRNQATGKLRLLTFRRLSAVRLTKPPFPKKAGRNAVQPLRWATKEPGDPLGVDWRAEVEALPLLSSMGTTPALPNLGGGEGALADGLFAEVER